MRASTYVAHRTRLIVLLRKPIMNVSSMKDARFHCLYLRHGRLLRVQRRWSLGTGVSLVDDDEEVRVR
jgi:hypothetical protein